MKPTSEPTIRERLAAIENEVRWLRYLVLAVFGAVIGQYLGLPGDAAQAVQQLLP